MKPLGSFTQDLAKPAEAMDAMVTTLRAPLAVCASLPGCKGIDVPLQLAWARLFVKAGLTTQEVDDAFDVYLSRSKFMPAPCEIIEIAKANRPAKFKRIDQTQAIEGTKPEPISRESRMAILAKHGPLGAAVIEKLEGKPVAEEVILTQEDFDRRDEMIRRMRGDE